ncbi:hypothetical protein K437DRAFT_74926 [Tilletiaria anomala UBC 951]|uniref:Uncharacterized protein n=1 Tax=Tilletiaria anomala (strain ATCC 24038 / CBS 436.72 / UBC 951) TaxID=1037660 RepID=A0A066WBP4_TILAU|nr:uncharacterized protein K437DRAFT_74926 [Tilletiaria anomala UBC 951]KDN49958.1 hypothetical protein K437DRAFT_74926 [Tilletiaria anomala UBC 951]
MNDVTLSAIANYLGSLGMILIVVYHVSLFFSLRFYHSDRRDLNRHAFTVVHSLWRCMQSELRTRQNLRLLLAVRLGDQFLHVAPPSSCPFKVIFAQHGLEKRCHQSLRSFRRQTVIRKPLYTANTVAAYDAPPPPCSCKSA